MFSTNLSCGSRYQTKLKPFICTSHNVYLRISKHINDLNQPPIFTTTVYVRDTWTSRYEGQCLWNQMHNRNCRSKKKRMAKHIGLIRWIAIICAWLPHLDTEDYRTMNNKAVYNFEESNHGKFVSGQIDTVFEYIKIKVWIIECHFYTITPPKCICGVRLWTGLQYNLSEGRELNHWFVISGFPKHMFIIQEFSNTRMVRTIDANFSVLWHDKVQLSEQSDIRQAVQ